MRTRRKPQKLCPDCKETNDCNKIEEVIDNFHENPIKRNKTRPYLALELGYRRGFHFGKNLRRVPFQ
ncbi:hypothetical protein RhiirA4_471784 [Rhizophagus irregularis]|uniref:Uncharacterized protein n=1 Tax=Rhizophagus irregularis TaxID=588596 RepID=A0A2I1H3R3_9GLOM|nr:hypothetical protein RhiirA4_471784 [Rhizophagus irregularis]